MSEIKTNVFDGDVSVGRNVFAGGDAKISGDASIGHNLVVKGWLDARNVKHANKGMFLSASRLSEVYPSPRDGWWALVGDSLPAAIYVACDGEWVSTGKSGGEITIDVEQYWSALTSVREELGSLLEEFADHQDSVDASMETLRGDIDELESKTTELDDDMNGNHIDSNFVTESSSVATHNYFECEFVVGETYTITNKDGGYIRKIYLADENNNAINDAFKIDGVIQGIINTIPNASSKTFECMVSAPKIHIYQIDTDPQATFNINGGSEGLNVRVKGVESIVEALNTKKVVHIGSTRDYTSILKAMRDNGANCIYKLDGETFDLRAEYIQEYGDTFFSAYSRDDYNSVDNFRKGLFLGVGCEVIGMSGTKILFNNVDGNAASKTFFSPFNLSTDNRLESVEIVISDAGCRYHIHDDFANLLASRGKNEIINCVFVGTPKETGCIGGGMYWGCTYIVEGCRFMSGKTYSMYYHNNANKLYEGTKNRLIIKDNYCATSLPIVVMYCGVSTEITDAYICNNRANIQKIPHTDSIVPTSIDNVELFEWNNISVVK